MDALVLVVESELRRPTTRGRALGESTQRRDIRLIESNALYQVASQNSLLVRGKTGVSRTQRDESFDGGIATTKQAVTEQVSPQVTVQHNTLV